MSDQTSTLLIRLISSGDLTALAKGKDQSEAMKVSVEGLKRALEGLGVGLSFGAALEGARRTAEYASSLKDLSDQANINVEALQAMAYVASDSGIKQEELAGALSVLNRNMAEAASGASKQNKAIADLGLNTAELLAMPVEQQIEAIARAYVNASDKGKAWADVVDLLGKGSSKLRGMMLDIAAGKKGDGLIVNSADIEAAGKFDDALERIKMQMKAIAVMVVARPGDALMTFTGHQSVETFLAQGRTKPAAPVPTAAEIAAETERRNKALAADPQIIASYEAVAKALADVGRAYETPIETAKRFREEAALADEKASKIFVEGRRTFDKSMILEADRHQIEAAQLVAQANALEAKAAQDKAKFAAEEADWRAKLVGLVLRSGPLEDQIVAARARATELGRQHIFLDEKSLTYHEDAKRIQTEILSINAQIAALEERAAAARVDDELRKQDNQARMQAIALAAIESDYTKTDAEKWHAKRDAIRDAIRTQEEGNARLRALSIDPKSTENAREKAGREAESGQVKLAGLNQQLVGMGPDPRSFVQTLKKDFTDLRSSWGTLQQQIAGGLTGALSTAVNSATNNLTRLVMGFQSLGQTIRGIATDILTTLVQSFVQMGVRWVAQQIMMAVAGKAIAAASIAALLPIAAAEAEVWAPAATLATIATFGGAAAQAPFAVAGSIALTQGLLVTGFETGGFTGGREGMPAGIVHGEEFVWSAPAVRAVGAGNLERAHRAALGGDSSRAGGGGRGVGGDIYSIVALSPEDVARSQRQYVGATVSRAMGRIPRARFAM